ncbi:MAG: hypothetical protein ACRDHX_17580 [Chloroflexota bacterium]
MATTLRRSTSHWAWTFTVCAALGNRFGFNNLIAFPRAHSAGITKQHNLHGFTLRLAGQRREMTILDGSHPSR